MHSCIYEGIVTHRRREPVDHQFRYRLFMVYLDLDELPQLVDRRDLFGRNKHTQRSFLRSDHLFDTAQPLADEVRSIVFQQTGLTSAGPIRLLTQLRTFGYYMSPLNLFYVFDEADRHIEYVVAEVNNTPWKERHCYVLWNGNRTNGTAGLEFSHSKEFHVSPFMDMDMQYQWHLTEPGPHLQVQLANTRDSRQVFEAGMKLDRRELGRQQLRRMTIRYPLMTARISAAIYLQALRLWWKKCPTYTHPDKRTNTQASFPIPQSRSTTTVAR